MATYKVPQDVEAEDKLLGPFSLKQLIFIMIFFASCWFAYIFAKITPPLAIVMLPFIIVSGVLGFVQRKDQPVEVYLAALIRFNTKTRKRIWHQGGYEHHVYITAPKKVEQQRYRNITQDEVHNRLGSIASMMDTRGWAAKGVASLPSDRLVTITSPKAEVENEISQNIQQQQAQVSSKFDELLSRRTNETRVAAIENMLEAKDAPSETTVQPAPQQQGNAADILFNPYPKSIRQSVISPASQSDNAQITTDNQQTQALPKQLSPDMIRLANNSDLTVSAIAREANALPSEEVVVSLH